ncbi:hypothetical protein FG95_01805 [Sphingopyxis sp. LC363]|nr:hypothetical protein FG95_01805 [Sphingopyxis sp. LC363]
MVLGAVSTSLSRVEGICQQIDLIRSQSEFAGDSLQWKNITERKYQDYERLCDFAVHLIHSHIIDFTAVIFDNHQVKNRIYNDGDNETGFQKFVCELFLCYVRKYRKPPEIHCFHGKRSSRFDMQHIRGILNARAAKKSGRYNYLPFDTLDYRDPSCSQMHQLNDFLLGIASWHWNPGMRKNLESPKSNIAKRFAREIGYAMMATETPVTAPHFDIWKFKLK